MKLILYSESECAKLREEWVAIDLMPISETERAFRKMHCANKVGEYLVREGVHEPEEFFEWFRKAIGPDASVYAPTVYGTFMDKYDKAHAAKAASAKSTAFHDEGSDKYMAAAMIFFLLLVIAAAYKQFFGS